jgi:hypothetical protein
VRRSADEKYISSSTDENVSEFSYAYKKIERLSRLTFL